MHPEQYAVRHTVSAPGAAAGLGAAGTFAAASAIAAANGDVPDLTAAGVCMAVGGALIAGGARVLMRQTRRVELDGSSLRVSPWFGRADEFALADLELVQGGCVCPYRVSGWRFATARRTLTVGGTLERWPHFVRALRSASPRLRLELPPHVSRRIAAWVDGTDVSVRLPGRAGSHRLASGLLSAQAPALAVALVLVGLGALPFAGFGYRWAAAIAACGWIAVLLATIHTYVRYFRRRWIRWDADRLVIADGRSSDRASAWGCLLGYEMLRAETGGRYGWNEATIHAREWSATLPTCFAGWADLRDTLDAALAQLDASVM